MNDERKNYGLVLLPIDDNPTSSERHYVLGGYSGIASRPILMPDGHGWSAYKPQPELQVRYGVETVNCTSYGTNNALETLARFHGFEDFPKDCSERYTGIATGTTLIGNDPHHVIEIIRTKCGEIPELSLPFNETITSFEEYYSPKDISALIQFGSRLLKRIRITHEWVIPPYNVSTLIENQKALMEALQHGPVCVSVYAWKQRGSYYYNEPSDVANHWLQLLDFKEGKWWLVYDHYDQVEKKLEWDYTFDAAKIYYMERITTTPNPLTNWQSFWDMVWSLFRSNGLLGRIWKS